MIEHIISACLNRIHNVKSNYIIYHIYPILFSSIYAVLRKPLCLSFDPSVRCYHHFTPLQLVHVQRANPQCIDVDLMCQSNLFTAVMDFGIQNLEKVAGKSDRNKLSHRRNDGRNCCLKGSDPREYAAAFQIAEPNITALAGSVPRFASHSLRFQPTISVHLRTRDIYL